MSKKLSIKIVHDPGYGKEPVEEVLTYYTDEGVREVLGVPHSDVVVHLDSIGWGYGIGWKLYTQHGPIIFPESVIDHLRASGVFARPEKIESPSEKEKHTS